MEAARSVCSFTSKVEVECCSIAQAREAAAAGADIIMLDNFHPQVQSRSSLLMVVLIASFALSRPPPSPRCNLQELHAAAQALKQEFPSAVIEASGGVTPETLPLYLCPHVDIISLGCLTQGCPVVDFSLQVQRPASQSNPGQQRSHRQDVQA